ncbi:hypothetical protein BZA77DRAFT_73838 [Pyronema omphalodes]|nr:hypothetical protein BZA77DRAFT_73838 [Pyronema omphalodes]
MPSAVPNTPLTPHLATLTTLITHLRASINTPTSSTVAAAADSNISPLDLLFSAATLLRAHVTRLSISLRPPVTVEAAEKDLATLSATILPSLVAAVTACSADAHGAVLVSEVRASVDQLLGAVGEYVAGAETGGDRLLNTGIVWNAADKVISLKATGLAGLVQKQMDMWQKTVKDAAKELKEFIETVDLGDDEDVDQDEELEDEEQAFWDRPTRKQALDEETKKAAEDGLKKIKMCAVLLGVAREGRLQGETKLTNVKRVDGMARAAKEISGLADDLGMAFYEDEDLEDVQEAKQELIKKAVELCNLCLLNDKDEKDALSRTFENAIGVLQAP